MKKDIFNGKVKVEYRKTVRNHLIIASIIVFVIATSLLLFAILYDEIQYGSRIVLFIICALGYLYTALYPLITVWCIRNYPKYKTLLKLLISDDSYFVDVVDKDSKNSF